MISNVMYVGIYGYNDMIYLSMGIGPCACLPFAIGWTSTVNKLHIPSG